MTKPTAKSLRHTALTHALELEAAGLPFSLVCVGCDAGDEVGSLAEAQAQGWTRLRADPTGLTWNFLGFCPHYNDATDECDEPRDLFTEDE